MLAFSNDYYGMIFRATQSVELFCAYTVKTKYPGVILSCHRRERQRRIVKFSPLCIFVLHDAFLLPVPLFPENDLHMQSSPAHAEI